MSYQEALDARNTAAADRSYEENHKFWRERLKRAQADGETAKAKDEDAKAAEQKRLKTYTQPQHHQCTYVQEPKINHTPIVYTSPEEFADICRAHNVDPSRAAVTVLFPGGIHGDRPISVVATDKLSRGDNAASPRYFLNLAAMVQTYGKEHIFDFDKKHRTQKRKNTKHWHNNSMEMSFTVKER